MPGITQPAAPCHIPADTDEEILLGVDTHKDFHAAAIVTVLGAALDGRTFPATTEGYRQLVAWARSFGVLRRAGVECTGSYGAALARLLRAEGIEVTEVNQPDKAARRRRGKTDAVDAEAAACAVLSGRATATAKTSEHQRLHPVHRRDGGDPGASHRSGCDGGGGRGVSREPGYLRVMEPFTFDYEDLHLRVDRGVFELFGARGSELRVPLRWLGALVHYKKPEKPGQLFIGTVRDPNAPLYGTDPAAFWYSTSPAFRVPPADEALFRAFFTEVAALADRRVV